MGGKIKTPLASGIKNAYDFGALLAYTHFLGGGCRCAKGVDHPVDLILLLAQADLGGIGWAEVVLADLPLLKMRHGRAMNQMEKGPPEDQNREVCGHMSQLG